MTSASRHVVQQPRVLVTGGAGFIGSALCRHMVADCGYDVLNVDKLTYAGNLNSLLPVADKPNYRFVQIDIADAAPIADAIREFSPDAIMHLAAETHVDRSIDSAAPFIWTNVVGTSVLLELARQHWTRLPRVRRERFRFLLVSTDEVYGSLRLDTDTAFRETTAYDPSSPYAASKAAADHLALAWHRTYELPVIISNCCNNFGPYQFPEKLIPLTTLNALEGRPVGVYGRGENVRDWLYVEDHARALVQVLGRGTPGEKYNIGARAERSNIAVVQTICDLLDEMLGDGGNRRSLIRFVVDRPGHDLRYAIDPGKVERELGWSAAASFESALRHTVAWYIENRWWWEPIRRGSYRGERLGELTAEQTV